MDEAQRIQTQQYAMTPREYWRVLVENYIRRRWYVFLLLGGAALLLAMSASPWAAGVIVLIVAYPLILVGYAWGQAKSPQNKIYYLPRVVELDSDYLSCYAADGGMERLRVDHFVSGRKTGAGFVLYLSSTLFLFIPFRAFKSKQDRNTFETVLHQKGVLR
jgi:hypothetical protein